MRLVRSNNTLSILAVGYFRRVGSISAGASKLNGSHDLMYGYPSKQNEYFVGERSCYVADLPSQKWQSQPNLYPLARRSLWSSRQVGNLAEGVVATELIVDDSEASGNSYHSPDADIAPVLKIQDLPEQRKAANRLIALPLGCFTPETWLDAEECLPWWSVARTKESVYISFQLWNRLFEEIKASNTIMSSVSNENTSDKDALSLESSTYPNSEISLINSEMFVRILNNWRVVYWNENTERYTPEHVLTLLDRYNVRTTRYQTAIRKSTGLNRELSGEFLVCEKAFYLIVDAAVRRRAENPTTTPRFAENCLESCIASYRNGNSSCFPTTELVNGVIRAWVYSELPGGKAYNTNSNHRKSRNRLRTVQDRSTDAMIPNKVENLMRLMTEFEIPFNSRTYNLAILAWANTESAAGALEAEGLLQRMHTEYLQGDLSVQPDPYAFTTTIVAWARSKSKDAGAKAEKLLKQFRLLRAKNEIKIPNWMRTQDHDFDSPLVNATIQCYANSGTRASAEYAQQLFDQMKLRLSTRRKRADIVAYLNLIRCWAAIGDAKQAESLMNDMLHDMDRTDLEPDIVLVEEVDPISTGSRSELQNNPKSLVYATVMSAWAKSKFTDRLKRADKLLHDIREKDARSANTGVYNAYLSVLASGKGQDFQFAASIADKLLKELRDRYENGEVNVRPDYITYATVIKTWASIGHDLRASEILRLMLDDYMGGNTSAKPDLQCFNSVLAAFQRSERFDAPERAIAFLENMQTLSQDGFLRIQPDVVSYTSLIATLAASKNNRTAAAEKAYGFLKQLNDRYVAGEKYLRPNFYTYNSVMNAWARAGEPEKAESVLKEMYEDYVTRGNTSAQPKTDSFNTVIKAWAFSKRPDATERAEEVLEQMIQLSDTGALTDVAPNTQTFTTMIMCYGLSKKSNSPKRADELFQQMIALYESGKLKDAPNRIAYSTLRKAWSNSRDPAKATRISEIDAAIKEKFHQASVTS